MKKISLGIFILLFSISSFGYALYIPNQQDKKILNYAYNKIDNINKNTLNIIADRIKKIWITYTNNDRLDYLLENLYNYIILKNAKSYQVVKVVDGDTIQIFYNGQKKSVRLIGLDTPESYKTRFGYTECYGKEASNYLKQLLSGKRIKLMFDPTQTQKGKYSRLLGYIFYNNLNINKLMIREGYGWEYTYNKYKPYIYQDLFKANEQYAKKNKLGLWNENTCNGKRIPLGFKTTKNQLIQTFSESNINCNKYISCSKMKSCQEAKLYFKKCGWKRMDADKDGIPCNNVCKQ